jgi:hypothetical protein
MKNLTLDEAADWFESHPCTLSAVNLLDVATEYWRDSMIEDGTYTAYVTDVSAYMRKRV